MKLRKPPHPDPNGTAVYFMVQADHRETAVETALAVIRDAAKREHEGFAGDLTSQALTGLAGDWVVESLLQGAWMREYHEWEKATKAYFDGNRARNGGAAADWRGKMPGIARPSHVDRVQAELEAFGAAVPADTLAAIDRARGQVNLAKHEADHFIDEADYKTFVRAVLAFWEALDGQEEFTVGR